MILPAVSVKQPWASWIAEGRKTIETRTKATQWRGPLVIVASRQPDLHLIDEAKGLPRGQALCVVNLVDCRPMTVGDEPAAQCRHSTGALAWVFRGLWPLSPFAVRGRLGIYTISVPPSAFIIEDLAEEVERLARAAAAAGHWTR